MTLMPAQHNIYSCRLNVTQPVLYIVECCCGIARLPHLVLATAGNAAGRWIIPSASAGQAVIRACVLAAVGRAAPLRGAGMAVPSRSLRQ